MRRIVVRRSPIDGRGVFALTNIPSGEFLVEYKSEVTSWRVASQRYQRNSAEDGHTFFFGLDDGHVIDGGRVRQSKRGIACLSGRSLTSWPAKSCSSTIGSTSKAAARLPSESPKSTPDAARRQI